MSRGPMRGREHGVVEALVPELEEDVVGGCRRPRRSSPTRRAGRGRRRRRTTPSLPPSVVTVPDERADADPEREQVEHRLDEAAEEQEPRPPERDDVAADHVAGHARARGERQPPRGPVGRLERRSRHQPPGELPLGQHPPTPMYASSTARCATPSQPGGVPVAASRHSSTPCHSGVTQAMGWRTTGSCSMREERAGEEHERRTTNR